MHIAHRFLTVLIAFPLLLGTGLAQEGAERPEHVAIYAPYQENVTFDADGEMDEEGWSAAAHRQLTLNGFEDEDAIRFAQVFVTHNGTHVFFALLVPIGLDLELQLHGTADGSFDGLTADGLRVLQDGTVVGRHWDRETADWRDDVAVDGCEDLGEAAVGQHADQALFEIARPLEGDLCSTQLRFDEDVRIRIALHEPDGSETYRWPEGSEDALVHVPDRDVHLVNLRTQIADWEIMRLETPEGLRQVDPHPTPNEPILDDSGWHTGDDRHGMDSEQPVHGIPEQDDPTYDHTGIPAPGIAHIALIGLAILGMLYLVRRVDR